MSAPPPRPRLAFLDGLRGIAALYVVLHHAYFEIAWNGGGLPPLLLRLTQWMAQGTMAVDIFIVLSGFCLMLPLLSAPDQQLAGGIRGFICRRAKRILPPYYAALAISLLLIATVPALHHRGTDRWDQALPAFTPGVLLSHLFLVHNLSSQWIWKIDNPAWSIATEWQIYFVFALLLVPIWRRFGMTAAVASSFVIGNIAEFFLPGNSEACLYFAGLFGLGMAAAALSRGDAYARLWSAAAVVFSGILFLAVFIFPNWLHQPKIAIDMAVGIATAASLVPLARASRSKRQPYLLFVLESPPAVALGRFSYSLYLIHFPVLAWFHVTLSALGLGPIARLVLMLSCAVPLSVFMSYGFHLLFERPFMASASADRRLPPDPNNRTAQVAPVRFHRAAA